MRPPYFSHNSVELFLTLFRREIPKSDVVPFKRLQSENIAYDITLWYKVEHTREKHFLILFTHFYGNIGMQNESNCHVKLFIYCSTTPSDALVMDELARTAKDGLLAAVTSVPSHVFRPLFPPP